MRDPAQLGFSLVAPAPEEIARKQSFAGAIELCAAAAGYSLDKQSCSDIGMDKARWSRIKSGGEGIKWDQLQDFMGRCGNDIPLLWMLHQRGYDLHSIRKRESETEKELRIVRETLDRERNERAVTEAAMRRMLVGVAS